MLAQMNNIQPKALPSAHHQRHINAMPRRLPKSQPRNLTGLYLGVEGDPGPPSCRKNKTLPTRTKGRGMPSRRLQTPTEEKPYCLPLDNDLDHIYESPNPSLDTYISHYSHNPTSSVNVPHFPPMPPPRYVLISMQKKADILRFADDHRGFSGNPVKDHQGRGITATDEKMRANMYPPESEQIWDVTKQTARQFTVAPNAGHKHLEYLKPDSLGTISSFNPKRLDKSLDDVLVEEIQQAVRMKKEVTGLIHCYNKICNGNSRTLHSLLPYRGSSPTRSSTYGRTGFNVKSYRMPVSGKIEANFPSMTPRPISVAGGISERPLVPSPYFFKLYSPPNTTMKSLRKHYGEPAEGMEPLPRSQTAPIPYHIDPTQLIVTPHQSPRPPCGSPAVTADD